MNFLFMIFYFIYENFNNIALQKIISVTTIDTEHDHYFYIDATDT